jgi:hypothetical protein
MGLYQNVKEQAALNRWANNGVLHGHDLQG